MVSEKTEGNELQAYIPCGGQRMAAVLNAPAGPAARAWVVMLHGFADDKVEKHRMFVKLGRRLAQHGIGSLRFDFLGCGDSDGEFEEQSIQGYVGQALAALDWLRKRPEVGGNALTGLLGYSLGGAIAACTAPQDGNIGALALWAPASNPYWNFINYLGEEPLRRGMHGEWVDTPDGERVGTAFFNELTYIDPAAELRKFEQEVFLIQGTADQAIIPLNALNFQQAFRHPDSKVHYIEGAAHRFDTYAHEQELLAETVEWFSAKLAPCSRIVP